MKIDESLPKDRMGARKIFFRGGGESGREEEREEEEEEREREEREG